MATNEGGAERPGTEDEEPGVQEEAGGDYGGNAAAEAGGTTHEPNDEGFAGGATAPQPATERSGDDAEDIAVPGDDLLKSVTPSDDE